MRGVLQEALKLIGRQTASGRTVRRQSHYDSGTGPLKKIPNPMLKLNRLHLTAIIRHALETNPDECCGLIGGTEFTSRSIYSVQNVAANPLITYEAAPEELFAAQKLMRERGEQMLAIYHSHPRASEPTPSDTDVRLAYYPAAIYLIIGLAGPAPVVRAFQISEKAQSWEQVEYEITDE